MVQAEQFQWDVSNKCSAVDVDIRIGDGEMKTGAAYIFKMHGCGFRERGQVRNSIIFVIKET